MRTIIEQKLNNETELNLTAEFASMIFEDIQKYVEEHMEEFNEWQKMQDSDSIERRGNHERQKG